ncbi:DUF397 domain-containing protein [Streptomyces liangshanensis]|uniref:DUF397 domain-containing protein n=1 Tax=Streptomyces liangshanensis TaxID=2717324 RepID=UPI0036DA08A8
MITSHQWVKSTYSGGEGGNCIEWSPTYAATHNLIPVRDSKNPTGPVLNLLPHRLDSPAGPRRRPELTGTLTGTDRSPPRRR